MEVNSMVERIASKIIEAKDLNGTTAAQIKYRAYFINTRLYLRYKADVDSILVLDGYEDCIVAE